MAKLKINSVDGYIAGFTGEVKFRLIKLRSIIKDVSPDSEEMISYNMPLYKYKGKLIVSFAAWKTHIGLYPVPKAPAELKRKLKHHEGAKSTLRFSHEEKLSIEIIKEVVELRLKQCKTGK